MWNQTKVTKLKLNIQHEGEDSSTVSLALTVATKRMSGQQRALQSEMIHLSMSWKIHLDLVWFESCSVCLQLKQQDDIRKRS